MFGLNPPYDKQKSCRLLPALAGFQLWPAFPNENLAYKLAFLPDLKIRVSSSEER